MAHTNEPCNIQMSRVKYEWVMSRMNASFIQPIAGKLAQNLQINSENSYFIARCTRILMEFMSSTTLIPVLIVNPMCRILVRQ